MARCRARTEQGTGPLCRNPVSESGLRCYLHVGLPEAPPRLPKPRGQRARRTRVSSFHAPAPRQRRQTASRAEREQRRREERVQKAADFCADVVIGGGWVDTVAERASGYVSEETWQRLLRGRRGRYCKALARAAENILAGKQKIHNALGFLASRGVRLLGGSDAIQAFTEELVDAIPLPLLDVKLVAAARGIQVTGVFLCVADDRDLTRCAVFRRIGAD